MSSCPNPQVTDEEYEGFKVTRLTTVTWKALSLESDFLPDFAFGLSFLQETQGFLEYK